MKKFSSKMKANSRRTSSRVRQYRIVLVGGLLVVLLVLTPWLAHMLAAAVTTPIVKTAEWFQTSTASLPQYLRNRTELLRTITDLQNEIATMRADRYATTRLERENTELRSLLNDTGDTRVVAGVIGRPPALPYDVLLLDRGAEAGLVPGAPVYIGNQTVIGVVRSVAPQTAIVDLVTSPTFSSLVYIMGPNVYAMASGIGGGQMMVGVPQGVSVATGDIVIMPSVSPGVYGAVTHIESVPAQAEQFVFVTAATPVNSIRLVTVATEPIALPSIEAIETTTAEAVRALQLPEVEVLLAATTTVSTTSVQSTTSPSRTSVE